MMSTRAQQQKTERAESGRSGDPGRDFEFTSADFARIRELIHRSAGISLSDHKRDMAYSRLARRLRARNIDSFKEYLDRLEADQDPAEWEAFTNALTTNLTAFFREAHHFPILAEFVKKRPAPVSVWCSAASTGEEPYSIAMTLIEALGESAARQATVHATDIDTQVLAKGEAGMYQFDQVKHLSPERLKRFFLKGTGAHAGMV
ncbi:MAG: chemotaxis protein CheR, partial [Paraburkholderia sp.]|nr:chemotaxis protein CheR [Paraburkholderia sp.]